MSDKLTPEQRALLDAGKDVDLHSLNNSAEGFGRDVYALVHAGLWCQKSSRPDGRGYMFTAYGPA